MADRYSTLELVERDKTAQAPERDNDATAFELDASCLAPEATPQIFYNNSLPEVNVSIEKFTERPVDRHALTVKIRLIRIILALIVVAAVAIGVGVGTWHHGRNNSSTKSPPTSGASVSLVATATSSANFSPVCYPFQDPNSDPALPACKCDGVNGTVPYLSSSIGQSNYNPCGFTTPSTTASAPVSSLTITGFSVSTTVASVTAASVSAASVLAASVSAASASAIYASAAATPSAGCWILSDDGSGDSSFEIYGINGWAGSEGETLLNQEEGCGLLSDFTFHTDGQDSFGNQTRNTQYAYFGLSLFKAGCVERAVHSAGGPAPGSGPDGFRCLHASNLTADQTKAVTSIGTAQRGSSTNQTTLSS